MTIIKDYFQYGRIFKYITPIISVSAISLFFVGFESLVNENSYDIMHASIGMLALSQFFLLSILSMTKSVIEKWTIIMISRIVLGYFVTAVILSVIQFEKIKDVDRKKLYGLIHGGVAMFVLVSLTNQQIQYRSIHR